MAALTMYLAFAAGILLLATRLSTTLEIVAAPSGSPATVARTLSLSVFSTVWFIGYTLLCSARLRGLRRVEEAHCSTRNV